MSPVWHVRCGTCLIDGTDRPLVIRESCESCSEHTASVHRNQGHDVTVTSPGPERVWVSKSVQQLTGRRSGW